VTSPTQKGVAGREQPMIFIVEVDTFSVTRSEAFHTVDLRTEVFGASAELRQDKLPDVPACRILDVRLPRMAECLRS
jgi:FixJ family two-component response regulator